MSDSNYTGAGRSRSRGQSRGRNSRTTGTGASKSPSRSSSRASAASSRRGREGGSGGNGFTKIAIAGVVLIAAVAVVVGIMKNMESFPKEKETTAIVETTAAEPETELISKVSVDGIDITGLSREDAKKAILKDFPWKMTVTAEDKEYAVTDLMAGKVDVLLDEIFTGEPKETYSIDTSGLEEAASQEAAAVAAMWNVKPVNGSISGYDSASDKFVFSGAVQGKSVDQEKLTSDILDALKQKKFDSKIEASMKVEEPEISEATAKEKYKTIATMTTNTTANSKRNTNVKLACQAINGTVLQPGQEFSFNETVGQRTEAKGYKGAAAYNNGEVVEEIGGGVCQVSSTLYNAVLKAGLKTTVRRSHTFEPSYVTPGTDATVSWGGPDYKFVNNSNTGIGIRASYNNQTCTVSIYAIPILEEGVTYSLKSEKKKDLGAPAPTYEEDPTLEPGVEKTKSNGSSGSYWETRLIITKNGTVQSQEIDHTTTYKGHNPVVLRNTSGTMAALPERESAAAVETVEANGFPGSVSATGPGDSTGQQPSQTAPGQSNTAPVQTQPAAEAPAQNQTSSMVPVEAPTAPAAAQNSNTGAGNAPGSGTSAAPSGPMAAQPSDGMGGSDIPIIAPPPGM